MNKTFACFLSFAWLLASASPLAAQPFSDAVVLSEHEFPSADSVGPPAGALEAALPGARFISAEQLGPQLEAASTKLLVLPYGSAFPEAAWEPILQFLRHGGDLLVLGGQPFTRAAYRDAGKWKLREYSVRFTRALMIDQYQETPASEGLDFETNSELTIQIPRFTWKRAFSPVIRLSAVDLYRRDGAAGSIDARLDALAWGVRAGRKMAAPAIQVDHLRNGFEGGRWIFLNAELTPDFYRTGAAAKKIEALAERALEGSLEFTVRPTLPLYLPGEPVRDRHSLSRDSPIVRASFGETENVCGGRSANCRGDKRQFAGYRFCSFVRAGDEGLALHRGGIARRRQGSRHLSLRILDS